MSYGDLLHSHFPLASPAGVSYGLTQQLFNFWRKNGFEPLYLRQVRGSANTSL
jgi:tRNA(Met) C34 N-acetyltransferase TmcA